MAITYTERWLEEAQAKNSSVTGWYKEGTNEVLKREKGLIEDEPVELISAGLIIGNTVKVGDVVPVTVKLNPFFTSYQSISSITFSDDDAATYDTGDKTITFNKIAADLTITVEFTGTTVKAIKHVKVIQNATSVTFDNTNSNWVAIGTPKTATLSLFPTTTDEAIVSAEFFSVSGVKVAHTTGNNFTFTGVDVGKYILIVNTTRNRLLVPYYVVAKAADVLTAVTVSNPTAGVVGNRSLIAPSFTATTAVYKDLDVISSDYGVVWYDYPRGEFVFAGEGSATVTVNALVGNAKTDVNFTVTATPVVPVSGVTVTANDTTIIADSTEHTFTYTVSPNDATNKNVTITVTG